MMTSRGTKFNLCRKNPTNLIHEREPLLWTDSTNVGLSNQMVAPILTGLTCLIPHLAGEALQTNLKV